MAWGSGSMSKSSPKEKDGSSISAIERGVAAIRPRADVLLGSRLEGLFASIPVPYSHISAPFTSSITEASKGLGFTRLPKTVKLRPTVGDEDLSVGPSTLAQLGAAAGEKRKRKAPGSPGPKKKKPKRRLACKPKKSSSSQSPDSELLFRLRDEPEDDIFVAREPTPPQERAIVEEEIYEVDLPKTRETDEKIKTEISRDAGHALKEAPGVIDISRLPSYTLSMLEKARTGADSAALEDFIGLGDLEVPRKQPSSETGGLNSSPKLISQFPAPSTDPGRKRLIIITIPEDARASVLHHESFLRYRAEFNQLEAEAEARELAEKRDMHKLLSEQHEGAVKNLRVELDAAQKEHADLLEQVKIFKVNDDDLDTATNDQTLQVQQKIDRIDQHYVEMNEVKAMADVWKEKLDRLASVKETAHEQLASVEVQLGVAKEKVEAQARKIKDLQAQLGLTVVE
ncbi:PREDICTED: MAP7 domain-containing protein 1-like [Nicotiana attenuata]|uniref:MAP7 domain-containing protein 1-like n=1 Tax=Nicotiana attenuata TaxID=49451 RepID=UPI00090486A3|nr:PREDICTED: MAP7 domain-containing protein 1-like [Nicotiana attenuata]